MTSFMIQNLADRQIAPSWNAHGGSCAFCRILQGLAPSFKVYEDDEVIAILDILPLRFGHTLVVPKRHISRLSELPPDLAAAAGKAISKVAKALTEATGNTGLNVVCNQEYAQAVPHVHYHIIPAPTLGASDRNVKTLISSSKTPSLAEIHQMEFDARQELDEEEGKELAQKIRSKL